MKSYHILCVCFLLNFNPIISKRTKPNVILFIADDLGYGDLGSSGHPTSITPNIDKLISKSLLFTNYYSASPLCSPSRSAIFTGEYPVRTGIYPGVFFPNSTGGLDPGKNTLMKELRRRHGYKSALIGKWHLGVGLKGEYLPTTSKNFDYFYGIPYAHDMCPCHDCFPRNECLSKCNDKFVACPIYENATIKEQPANLATLTQRYTSRAIDFVRKNYQNRFFLTVAFHQPHHPQFAGAKFYNSSNRGSFGDALMEMDDAVSQIYNVLKKLGITSKTLIMFTSDNGPSLLRQERGGCAGLLRCGKGTTYEGGMRVPFFMHWPGFIQPKVSHTLITALDIYPTLLSIISVRYANSTDGFDFTRHILKNKYEYNPRQSFLYFPGSPSKSQGPFAVRYKQYKAHLYTQGNELSDGNNYDFACTAHANLTVHNPPLLYDLSLDPGERYPLDPETHKDLMLELQYEAVESYKKILWADGEMNKPNSNEAQPCAKKGCSNFPNCCNTLSLYPQVRILD